MNNLEMVLGPVLISEGSVWLGTDESGTIVSLTPKEAILLAAELINAAAKIIDQEAA